MTMSTRSRWLLAAGCLLLVAIIGGAAVANAVRLHSMGPVWSVGWLPAVLVATWPGLYTRRGGQRRCLERLRPRRPAGS